MTKAPNKPPGNYKVGYGRPPKSSQFKSGQSGNPKGRPKGQPTASDIFTREAARVVRIKLGDKVESISKLEAVMRKLFQLAILGDVRAMSMLLGQSARLELGRHEGNPDDAGDILSTALPDEDTVRRILSRFDHLKPV